MTWKIEIKKLSILFKSIFLLRTPRVVNFADNIKIAPMFVKKTFENAERFKMIINFVLKCNIYLYFLIEKILPIFDKKMLMSREVKGVLRDLYFLESS